MKASARRQTNALSKIKDLNEIWQYSDEKIKTVVLDYYNELFAARHLIKFSNVLDAIDIVNHLIL